MNRWHVKANSTERNAKRIEDNLAIARQAHRNMTLSMANGGTWTDKEIAKITAKLEKAQAAYDEMYGVA